MLYAVAALPLDVQVTIPLGNDIDTLVGANGGSTYRIEVDIAEAGLLPAEFIATTATA